MGCSARNQLPVLSHPKKVDIPQHSVLAVHHKAKLEIRAAQQDLH